MESIAALVSGGVDSSVVVHLLCEQGTKPDIFYIRIELDVLSSVLFFGDSNHFFANIVANINVVWKKLNKITKHCTIRATKINKHIGINLVDKENLINQGLCHSAVVDFYVFDRVIHK